MKLPILGPSDCPRTVSYKPLNHSRKFSYSSFFPIANTIAIVFAIGKKLEYENLREWFKGLYETVLGQSEGPRMGSFIKLYGIEPTKKLLENVILGNLVKE